ncbi:MAG: hypothetical protein H6607_01110 [Flavobacteriales bacterium]|nr:hypothetical protein [Flavobacteriales bacterium]
MKVKFIFQIFLLQIVYLSCVNNSTNTEGNYIEKKSDSIRFDTIIASPKSIYVDQFSNSRLSIYRQKLDSLFRYVDSELRYKLVCDTLDNEIFTRIEYRFELSKKWRSLNTRFSVYQFKSRDSAKWFFNDLYTQQHIYDFGIDKTDHYVVRNGKILIWHHFNSPYSHKFKDIIAQFIETFNITCGNDSDSMIAENCCQNWNDIKKIPKEICRNWRPVLIGYVLDTTTQYDCWYVKPGISELKKKPVIEKLNHETPIEIIEKSMKINNTELGFDYIQQLTFPSSELYFKHLKEEKKSEALNDFFEINETLPPGKINVFRLRTRMVTIYQLSNHQILLQYGAYLYRLNEAEQVK